MSVRLVNLKPTRTAPSRRRLLVGVLAALWIISSLPAQAANPEEARIAQTRAELEAVRAELEGAREEAEDHQIALEEADRQLRAAFDAVDAAAQAVARQEDAVKDAEVRLGEARRVLADQRALMGDRVARLYRHARPDPLIHVLDASSVTEAVQQSAYMTAIGRQDRAAVESLGNAEMTVAAEEQALEAEQVSLGRVLEEQQVVLGQVEEMREDRALVAAASEELVARLQSREHHLESEAEQLAAIARQREAEAAAAAQAQAAARQPASSTPATSGGGSGQAAGDGDGGAQTPAVAPAPPPPPSGGGLSWPTSGSVTSEFGPRWGRQHNGMDIANGSGTAVAAARGGTVTHAGTLGGFGNLVVIAHGNGLSTAYAHLSSIAVSNGQSVSTGTFLGGMGCTGSCTGTHLHFEVRVNGTPVDPRGYL